MDVTKSDLIAAEGRIVEAMRYESSGIYKQIGGLSTRIDGFDLRLGSVEQRQAAMGATMQLHTHHTSQTSENRSVTRRDVYMFIAGISALWLVMKTLGLLSSAVTAIRASGL
jgi:hypothetical protein